MGVGSKTGSRIRLKDTIAYGLLRVVFAIYFTFAVSITGYHMYLDYNTAKSQIIAQLGLIEKAFEDSLSTALFDLDTRQLQLILIGLREMHALVGVSIEPSNSDIFIPHAAIGVIATASGDTIDVDDRGETRPADVPVTKLITHDFILYQPDTETEIARGRLYSSDDVVFASVESSFVRLVISAIAKTALLWALFLWASAGRLSLPLRKFANDVGRVDLDAEQIAPVKLVRRTTKRDELAVLSEAFEAMQDRIQRHLASLNTEKAAALAARDEADNANRAKAIFLSRMSHELRTPLNAIIGFSALQLRRTDAASNDHQQLQHILEAGKNLLELVDDIMGVVDSGNTRIELRRCNVDELVQESMGSVQGQADERRVSITARPCHLFVLADRAKLVRLMSNLLSNAVLYNHDGGHVVVTAMVTDRDRVRIEVADSGVGIASDDHAQVFEPFSRLEHAESSRIPGVGMGLVVVKAFTQAMNGQVGLVSEPGEGTRVWVELDQAGTAPAIEGSGYPVHASIPSNAA